jgi:hypothetical protein
MTTKTSTAKKPEQPEPPKDDVQDAPADVAGDVQGDTEQDPNACPDGYEEGWASFAGRTLIATGETVAQALAEGRAHGHEQPVIVPAFRPTPVRDDR